MPLRSFVVNFIFMKVLGLIAVLCVSVGLGVLYWNSKSWDAVSMPASYKVMEDLETKGLYQREMEFVDIDGKPHKVSDYKGKIVILSFWATWCEPCVEEFPSFIKLMDTYPDKVVLVAISHDYEPKDVKEFVKAFKGFRKNLVLTMDSEKALSKSFGVDRLPEGFVFDANGKLVKKIIGIQDWASKNALEYFKEL